MGQPVVELHSSQVGGNIIDHLEPIRTSTARADTGFLGASGNGGGITDIANIFMSRSATGLTTWATTTYAESIPEFLSAGSELGTLFCLLGVAPGNVLNTAWSSPGTYTLTPAQVTTNYGSSSSYGTKSYTPYVFAFTVWGGGGGGAGSQASGHGGAGGGGGGFTNGFLYTPTGGTDQVIVGAGGGRGGIGGAGSAGGDSKINMYSSTYNSIGRGGKGGGSVTARIGGAGGLTNYTDNNNYIITYNTISGGAGGDGGLYQSSSGGAGTARASNNLATATGNLSTLGEAGAGGIYAGGSTVGGGSPGHTDTLEGGGGGGGGSGGWLLTYAGGGGGAGGPNGSPTQGSTKAAALSTYGGYGGAGYVAIYY